VYRASRPNAIVRFAFVRLSSPLSGVTVLPEPNSFCVVRCFFALCTMWKNRRAVCPFGLKATPLHSRRVLRGPTKVVCVTAST